jgi:hypothetical protein
MVTERLTTGRIISGVMLSEQMSTEKLSAEEKRFAVVANYHLLPRFNRRKIDPLVPAFQKFIVLIEAGYLVHGKAQASRQLIPEKIREPGRNPHDFKRGR